jgi:hypothetical protein
MLKYIGNQRHQVWPIDRTNPEPVIEDGQPGLHFRWASALENPVEV